MDLETAKKELLYDAVRNKNEILLVETSDGACVKGYCAPQDWRQIYVAALDVLISEGCVEPVFKNPEMQLFVVTPIAPTQPTLCSAKQRILQEIQNNGFVYKIHSCNGEFVQCADETFESFESTRILFNHALADLLRSGAIDVVNETREMCTYAQPKMLQEHKPQAELELRVPVSPHPPLELCA